MNSFCNTRSEGGEASKEERRTMTSRGAKLEFKVGERSVIFFTDL